MEEEDGLDIVRAYDTIYGFIMAQEVHVRAELFQNLDTLYHWARKASTTTVPSADEKATSAKSQTESTRSGSVSGASSSTASDTAESPHSDTQANRSV